MRTGTKIMAVLAAVAILLSVTGVFATWHYSSTPTSTTDSVTISNQMLPPTTEAHNSTILEIIKALNTPDSALNKVIQERRDSYLPNVELWDKDNVGSMDDEYGPELREYIKDDTKAYMIKYSYEGVGTNTVYKTYEIYTTSKTLALNRKISPVYKTKLKIDDTTGIWSIEYTLEGTANTYEYEYTHPLNGLWMNTPAINPDTWVEN